MNAFAPPVDLDEIRTRNGALTIDLVKMLFRGQSDDLPPDVDPKALWQQIIAGVGDVSTLSAEVDRLRAQRQRVRDLHAPLNSPDPAAPGAVCTACSAHGERVGWPRSTWAATEDRR